MSDPKGFLNHRERELPPSRPVPVRIKDWREVQESPLPDVTRRQSSRCMQCGTPFCHWACPLGNLIPDFNNLVHEGKWEEAYEKLLETNNFPEFTGMVCPAPCETSCVLAINQQPVTIKSIELAIAKEQENRGPWSTYPPQRLSQRTVAVVGSGPAGLAAAQQLTRRGHTVVIYDSADKPGGLLRYGIPDFKLRDSLSRSEIQAERPGELRPLG